MSEILAQTTRNMETAEKVNKIMAEAHTHGIETTRRQARKMLQGRGSLGRLLAEARKAAQATHNPE